MAKTSILVHQKTQASCAVHDSDIQKYLFIHNMMPMCPVTISTALAI